MFDSSIHGNSISVWADDDCMSNVALHITATSSLERIWHPECVRDAGSNGYKCGSDLADLLRA